MFFKLKLPIVEDLMDWLNNDDRDRADIEKHRIPSGTSFCGCGCSVTDQTIINFMGSFSQ